MNGTMEFSNWHCGTKGTIGTNTVAGSMFVIDVNIDGGGVVEFVGSFSVAAVTQIAQHFGINRHFHIQRCALSDSEIEPAEQIVEDAVDRLIGNADVLVLIVLVLFEEAAVEVRHLANQRLESTNELLETVHALLHDPVAVWRWSAAR